MSEDGRVVRRDLPGWFVGRDEFRSDPLPGGEVLEFYRAGESFGQPRWQPRLRGGATGGEAQFALAQGTQWDFIARKTVFARTRYISVESDVGPTSMEFVRTPARALPAERGWPDRRVLWLAERDAVQRLAALAGRATVAQVFPPAAGYEVAPEYADLLVPPLRIQVGCRQDTVSVPVDRLTSLMLWMLNGNVAWEPTLHRAFTDALSVAQQVARSAAGRPADEVSALAGVVALSYLSAQALARYLARPEDGSPKRYMPLVSRVSPRGLRRALPDDLAAVLTEHRAWVREQVGSRLVSGVPDAYPAGTAAEVALSTPVFVTGTVRGAQVGTIGDYLDNLLLDDPPVVMDQTVLDVSTVFDGVDTHDGRLSGRSVVPVEIRFPRVVGVEAMRDINTVRLTRVVRAMYASGHGLGTSERVPGTPPWGRVVWPGSVVVEVGLPARAVGLPGPAWLLYGDHAAVVADGEDGLLHVVGTPLAAGVSPELVEGQLAEIARLVDVVNDLVGSAWLVGQDPAVPAGVSVNPAAAGARVDTTRSAYGRTDELSVGVPVDGLSGFLRDLAGRVDRSQPWFYPESVAAAHLDAGIDFGVRVAGWFGLSPAAAGYLALAYVEAAGYVHVLHDALPETYTSARTHDQLLTSLGALPWVDQQLLAARVDQISTEFARDFTERNAELVADLRAEAAEFQDHADVFHRTLEPFAFTVNGYLEAVLTNPLEPADAHVVLETRYLSSPADTVRTWVADRPLLGGPGAVVGHPAESPPTAQPPRVAPMPGVAGEWLTSRFQAALDRASRQGDSDLVARWEAMAARIGPNPSRALLDEVLAFVDGVGEEAAGSSSDPDELSWDSGSDVDSPEWVVEGVAWSLHEVEALLAGPNPPDSGVTVRLELRLPAGAGGDLERVRRLAADRGVELVAGPSGRWWLPQAWVAYQGRLGRRTEMAEIVARVQADGLPRVVVERGDATEDEVADLVRGLVHGRFGIGLPVDAVVELSRLWWVPESTVRAVAGAVADRPDVPVDGELLDRADLTSVAAAGRTAWDAGPGWSGTGPGRVYAAGHDFSGRVTLGPLVWEWRFYPARGEDFSALHQVGTRPYGSRAAGSELVDGRRVPVDEYEWPRPEGWLFVRRGEVLWIPQAVEYARDVAAGVTPEPTFGPQGLPEGARVVVVGPGVLSPQSVLPTLLDLLNGAQPARRSGSREPVYVVVHGWPGGWASTVALVHAAEDDLWPVALDEVLPEPAHGWAVPMRDGDDLEVAAWAPVRAELERIAGLMEAARPADRWRRLAARLTHPDTLAELGLEDLSDVDLPPGVARLDLPARVEQLAGLGRRLAALWRAMSAGQETSRVPQESGALYSAVSAFLFGERRFEEWARLAAGLPEPAGPAPDAGSADSDWVADSDGVGLADAAHPGAGLPGWLERGRASGTGVMRLLDTLRQLLQAAWPQVYEGWDTLHLSRMIRFALPADHPAVRDLDAERPDVHEGSLLAEFAQLFGMRVQVLERLDDGRYAAGTVFSPQSDPTAPPPLLPLLYERSTGRYDPLSVTDPAIRTALDEAPVRTAPDDADQEQTSLDAVRGDLAQWWSDIEAGHVGRLSQADELMHQLLPAPPDRATAADRIAADTLQQAVDRYVAAYRFVEGLRRSPTAPPPQPQPPRAPARSPQTQTPAPSTPTLPPPPTLQPPADAPGSLPPLSLEPPALPLEGPDEFVASLPAAALPWLIRTIARLETATQELDNELPRERGQGDLRRVRGLLDLQRLGHRYDLFGDAAADPDVAADIDELIEMAVHRAPESSEHAPDAVRHLVAATGAELTVDPGTDEQAVNHFLLGAFRVARSNGLRLDDVVSILRARPADTGLQLSYELDASALESWRQVLFGADPATDATTVAEMDALIVTAVRLARLDPGPVSDAVRWLATRTGADLGLGPGAGEQEVNNRLLAAFRLAVAVLRRPVLVEELTGVRVLIDAAPTAVTTAVELESLFGDVLGSPAEASDPEAVRTVLAVAALAHHRQPNRRLAVSDIRTAHQSRPTPLLVSYYDWLFLPAPPEATERADGAADELIRVALSTGPASSAGDPRAVEAGMRRLAVRTAARRGLPADATDRQINRHLLEALQMRPRALRRGSRTSVEELAGFRALMDAISPRRALVLERRLGVLDMLSAVLRDAAGPASLTHLMLAVAAADLAQQLRPDAQVTEADIRLIYRRLRGGNGVVRDAMPFYRRELFGADDSTPADEADWMDQLIEFAVRTAPASAGVRDAMRWLVSRVGADVAAPPGATDTAANLRLLDTYRAATADDLGSSIGDLAGVQALIDIAGARDSDAIRRVVAEVDPDGVDHRELFGVDSSTDPDTLEAVGELVELAVRTTPSVDVREAVRRLAASIEDLDAPRFGAESRELEIHQHLLLVYKWARSGHSRPSVEMLADAAPDVLAPSYRRDLFGVDATTPWDAAAAMDELIALAVRTQPSATDVPAAVRHLAVRVRASLGAGPDAVHAHLLRAFRLARSIQGELSAEVLAGVRVLLDAYASRSGHETGRRAAPGSPGLGRIVELVLGRWRPAVIDDSTVRGVAEVADAVQQRHVDRTVTLAEIRAEYRRQRGVATSGPGAAVGHPGELSRLELDLDLALELQDFTQFREAVEQWAETGGEPPPQLSTQSTQRRVHFAPPAPPATTVAPPATTSAPPEASVRPRQAMHLRAYARRRADYHRRAAEAGGDTAGLHRVMEAFYRGFPHLGGALDGLPRFADLLPLVRAVLDDTAVAVSDAHVTRLAELAAAVATRGPVTVATLRHRVEFDRLRERLGLDDAAIRGIADEIGVSGADAAERALQVAALQQELSGTPHGLDARSLHRIAQVARQELARGGAGPAGPLLLGDLLPLVRHALEPQASAVLPDHLTRLAEAIRTVRGVPGRTVRPRDLARIFTRAARHRDGADGTRNRAAELANLRDVLDHAEAGQYDEADLIALVEARRAYHPDPRTRGYTHLGDYAPMVLNLLGEYPAQVTSVHIASLSDLVRRVRATGEGTPVAATATDPDRRPRTTLVRRAHVTATAEPGERPRAKLVKRVRAVGTATQVTPAALARAAVERDWSTGVRPVRWEGPDGNLAYLSVPGLHYVTAISNAPALVRWLNGVVPAGGDWISEDQLLVGLRTAFSQALDEGLPDTVRLGGSAYRVELRPGVVGPPVRDREAPVPVAKLEQRVNRIARELQGGHGTSRSGYADFGVAVRVGSKGVATGTGGGTGGGSRAKGRSYATVESVGNYLYLKPEDLVGQLDVPVTWSVRITDLDSGRWRDLTWTPGGAAQQETVSLYAPLHLLEPPDATQQMPDPARLRLWDMHHAVERVLVVDRLRAAVRRSLGAAEYGFWRTEIEHFLSSDEVASVLADAHRTEPGRWQYLPKLVVRKEDRFLNLALTAAPVSLDPVGVPTKKVKYDRISQAISKSTVNLERRRAGRGTLGAVLRAFFGLFHVGSRGLWTRARGRLSTRGQMNTLQRTMRASDVNQVVKLGSEFTVHADWGSDKATTYRTQSEPVPGWSYIRVRQSELNPPNARPAATGATPVWWTPQLRSDHGVGYGNIRSLLGIDQLYDSLVPPLVERGYLPSEAGAADGRTPWDRLQNLRITGVELNKAGATYENWRLLVDTISDPTLVARVDDLTGAVVPLELTHPQGNRLVLELSAAVTGSGAYQRTDSMMPVNVLVDLHATGIRHTRTRASDTVPIEGGVGDLGAAGELFDRQVPIGGMAGRTREFRRTDQLGESVSSSVMTYARTEGPTSLFSLPVRFRWTAYDGTANPPSGQQSGRALAWQSNSLTVSGDHVPPPPLGVLAAGPSPLIGMTLRGVVTASGVRAMQQALITASRERLQVRRGVTPLGYKTNLPLALSGGWPVAVGGEQGMLRTTPLGRPQILKQVKVYTEQMQESQAGREQDKGDTFTGRGWRWSGGFRPSLPDNQGGTVHGKSKGRGTAAMAGRTEGLYRDLTSTTDLYVVRTAASNRLRFDDGVTVSRRGELVLLLSKADVLARGADRFDDPYHLLPASPPAPGEVREAPQSLRDGRLWGVFPDPIGRSRFSEEVAQAAHELGGADLRAEVEPLLSVVGIHLPEMDDGGKGWELRTGRKWYQFWKRYELTVEAHAAGDPRFVYSSPSFSLKLYSRSNDSSSRKERQTTTVTRGAAGGPSFGSSDETSAPVTISATQASTDERADETGYNMLTMDGARPKGVAEFLEPVEFAYTLRRRGLFALFGRRNVRTGGLVERREAYVARDGSPTAGQSVQSWDGVLRGIIPAGTAVVGAYGLSAIADTARENGGVRVRRGTVKSSPAVLSFASMVSQLPAMLRSEGAQFNGVTSGAGELKLPGGMTVRASFGKPRQLFYVPTSELEHYGHRTVWVGQASSHADKYAGSVTASVLVPLPPAPMVKVGPRLGLGGDRTTSDGQAVRQATEHRSWLRMMTGAYHIYAELNLTVTVGSHRPEHHVGAIELVTSRDGALALGIPADALDAVAASPATKPKQTLPTVAESSRAAGAAVGHPGELPGTITVDVLEGGQRELPGWFVGGNSFRVDTGPGGEPVEFYRAGVLFGQERWLPRGRGGRGGMELEHPAGIRWPHRRVPRDPSNPGDRIILGTSPVGLRLDADGLDRTVPETVTPPMLRLDDEVVGADRDTVLSAVEQVHKRFVRTRGKGSVLRRLFPEYEYDSTYGEVRLPPRLYDTTYVQHTEGLPLEGLYEFYAEVRSYPVNPVVQVVGRGFEILDQGLRFGAWVAERFNGGVAADLVALGPAATAAGHGTMEYTLGAAQAGYLHQTADLAKNLLAFAPRVHLPGVLAALPVEHRLFFEAYAPAIRDQFQAHFTEHNASYVAELRGARPGIDIMHSPVLRAPGHTVTDLLDGGLVPEPARNVTPRQALAIKTWLARPDTNEGHLKHTELLVGELRYLGNWDARSAAEWVRDDEWLGSTVRRIYRRVVAARTVLGDGSPPVDLGRVIEDLRRQLASVEGLSGEAASRLAVVRRGALELLAGLWDPERRVARERVDLSVLLPVVAALPQDVRGRATRAAVESVHIRLDSAARAAVRRVDATAVGLSADDLRQVGQWFPNATVAGPHGEAPPVRWVQPSDMFTGANTAPERVGIAELVARLGELADAAGGVAGLAERVGVRGGPGVDTEQVLRDLAYLAGAVFGPARFTERDLVAMRRLADAARSGGGSRFALWDDMEALVRRAGADAAVTRARIAVRMAHGRLLAHAVREHGRDGMTADDLQALRWFPDTHTFHGTDTAPGIVDQATVLARLVELADAAGGMTALAARALAGDGSRAELEQALRNAAYLTAVAFGTQYTQQDLTAVGQLMSAPVHAGRPRPASWGDLEAVVRELRGDDPAQPAPVQVHHVRLLAYAMRAQDRVELSMDDLRALRWLPGVDIFATADTTGVSVNLAAMRDRLTELADDAGGLAALIRRVGVGGEQVLGEAAVLASAAAGDAAFTEQDLHAVRRVMYAPQTSGKPRLTRWGDLAELAKDLTGDETWRNASGNTLRLLVGLLLHAVRDLSGDPVTLGELRTLRWVPTSAMFLDVPEPPVRVPLGRVIGQLVAIAEAKGGWEAMLDQLPDQSSVPPGQRADPRTYAATEQVLAEATYLVVVAFEGRTDFHSEDLVAMRRLMYAPTHAGRPRLRSWSDLDGLVAELRGDDSARRVPATLPEVRLLLRAVREADREHMTMNELRELRWRPTSEMVAQAKAVAAPVDHIEVLARLAELAMWSGGYGGLLGEVDPSLTLDTVEEQETLLRNVAYLAAGAFGASSYSVGNLATTWGLMSAPTQVGRPRLTTCSDFEAVVRELRADDPARPGPVEAHDVRSLVDAADDVDRAGDTIDDLRRQVAGTDEPSSRAVRELAKLRNQALLDRLTEAAGGTAALVDRVGVRHGTKLSRRLDRIAFVGMVTPDDEEVLADVVRLAGAVYDSAVKLDHLPTVRRLMFVPLADGLPRLAAWSDVAALIREVRGDDPAGPPLDVEPADARLMLQAVERAKAAVGWRHPVGKAALRRAWAGVRAEATTSAVTAGVADLLREPESAHVTTRGPGASVGHTGELPRIGAALRDAPDAGPRPPEIRYLVDIDRLSTLAGQPPEQVRAELRRIVADIADDRVRWIDRAGGQIALAYSHQMASEVYPELTMAITDIAYLDEQHLHQAFATPGYQAYREAADRTAAEAARWSTWAEAFARYDETFTEQRLDQLAEGLAQSPFATLTAYDGFVISEQHGDVNPWTYITEHLGDLKAAGLDTVYLESLRHDDYQSVVDAYLSGGETTLPFQLERFARRYDASHHLGPAGGLRQLLLVAKQHAVRVVGIDDTSARPLGHGRAAAEDRVTRMNAVAERLVTSDAGRRGKYVVLVGEAHAHTHEHRSSGPSDPLPSGVPGLAQRLLVPAARITAAGTPELYREDLSKRRPLPPEQRVRDLLRLPEGHRVDHKHYAVLELLAQATSPATTAGTVSRADLLRLAQEIHLARHDQAPARLRRLLDRSDQDLERLRDIGALAVNLYGPAARRDPAQLEAVRALFDVLRRGYGEATGDALDRLAATVFGVDHAQVSAAHHRQLPDLVLAAETAGVRKVRASDVRAAHVAAAGPVPGPVAGRPPELPANTVALAPDGSYAVAREPVGRIPAGAGFSGFDIFAPGGIPNGHYDTVILEGEDAVGVPKIWNNSPVPGAWDLAAFYATEHSDKPYFDARTVGNEKLQALLEAEYGMTVLPSSTEGSKDYRLPTRTVNEIARRRLEDSGWTLVPGGGSAVPVDVRHAWTSDEVGWSPVRADGSPLRVVVETLEDGTTRAVSGRFVDRGTFEIVNPATGNPVHRLYSKTGPDGKRTWSEGVLAAADETYFYRAARNAGWSAASDVLSRTWHWAGRGTGLRSPADKAREFVQHVVDRGVRLRDDLALAGYGLYRAEINGRDMLVRALVDDAGAVVRARRPLPLDRTLAQFHGDGVLSDLVDAGWRIQPGHHSGEDAAAKRIGVDLFNGGAAWMAIQRARDAELAGRSSTAETSVPSAEPAAGSGALLGHVAELSPAGGDTAQRPDRLAVQRALSALDREGLMDDGYKYLAQHDPVKRLEVLFRMLTPDRVEILGTLADLARGVRELPGGGADAALISRLGAALGEIPPAADAPVVDVRTLRGHVNRAARVAWVRKHAEFAHAFPNRAAVIRQPVQTLITCD